MILSITSLAPGLLFFGDTGVLDASGRGFPVRYEYGAAI